MDIDVCEVAYGSSDFQQLVDIRMQVFVDEQKCNADTEIDEYDKLCVHLGLKESHTGKFLAVCRIVAKPPFVKLERVATLKNYRGRGFAEKLNNEVIRVSRGKWPNLLLVAHAQSAALPFYRKLGFFVVGPEFLEEGIAHRCIVHVDPSGDYDSSVFTGSKERTKTFVLGEYTDEAVRQNIKDLVEDVQAARVIPLETVLSVVEKHGACLGLAYNLFLNYARVVCALQSFPEVIEHADAVEKDEKALVDLGWTKLNTGHYSQVAEHWRRFYFAVYLVKSIRLCTSGNFIKSLHILDEGLMMGGRYLERTYICRRTVFLQEKCPPLSPLMLPNNPVDEPPKPLEGTELIPIVNPMTDEVFLELYLLPQKPVVIKGAVKHIPAFGKWNLPYMAKKLAWRRFPVEWGSRYTDESWEQHLMSAEEFFKKVAFPDSEKGPVYLAQHRLLEQVPELLDDVPIPSYCLAAGLDEQDVDINAWIGPTATVSPLHTDPKDNLFCQISGRKFFRLVAPEDSLRVYPNEEGVLTNTSQVDMEEPMIERFPLLAGIRTFDAVVDEGDALFIPRGWWHHVRSLSPSISLSFWFENEL